MHRYKHLIILLCLLTLYSCQDKKEIIALRKQYAILRFEVSELDHYIRKSEKLEELNKQLKEKVKTVERLKSMHGLISPMLKNVFLRIPAAVHLKEFFFSTGTIDLIFRQKIPRGNKAKENEKKIDEEINKKIDLLQKLEITFPPQIKTKQVLEDIYRTASESQVKITRLEIKDEIIEESFSKKPIHLDICASVNQLIHFISTIEKSAMIYQLETFYLVTNSDSTSGCYELALKLYVFQDQKSSTQRRINRGSRRRRR